MQISNDDFNQLEHLIYYFEQAMGLKDYHQEAYEELEEILERVRKHADAKDGYCDFCGGIRLQWAWELVNGDYNAGGFWFCPNCKRVLRPRPDGLLAWTKLIVSEPHLSNDEHILGREAILENRD
jgi:hypothetical protein